MQFFVSRICLLLKVNFEDDSRGKYLELLGYRKEDLGKKVNFWKSLKAVLTQIKYLCSRGVFIF